MSFLVVLCMYVCICVYLYTGKVKIYSRVMRDFVGMDDVSENAKYALLDFSYNLTLGKLDDAYRAVKAIDRLGYL